MSTLILTLELAEVGMNLHKISLSYVQTNSVVDM